MNDSDDRTFETDEMEDDFFEEKTPSSPIGRLMDDDDTDNEPSTYVSGFDRDDNRPPLPSPTERRTRRERPAQPPQDESDDFFEAGMREARASRDRDRRRQPNPSPKPAVRANVPTQRRMAGPPPRRNEEEIPISSGPPEDKYDTFRQRYNPDELISTSRSGSGGGRPVRAGQRPQRNEVDLSASRGFAPRRRDEDDDDGSDYTGMVRIIAFAAALAFIGVIIFLGFSRASINRQLTEANETIAAMQAAHAGPAGWENVQNELNAEINRLNGIINDYQAQLNALQDPYTPPQGGLAAGNDLPPGDPAPPAQNNLPATHVVVRGDSLTSIAIRFYGRGTNAENHLRAQHIATYNNLRNLDDIYVGQVLTIPPLP